MYANDCFALMGSMGWMGWLMPLTVMLLLGLGIAALAKYLFTSRRSREDRS
ncbi:MULTISPECIES: hypothetical protein [Halomonadaceae]|jgi:hypothetical protein|uniref:Uncharacterized protein n=1 Tax=Chromohalobacter canadensis TaxID=141389 RepID=A0A285VIR9_9GAMM|nr:MULTISPECIES: hypothetical protein [Halomonadaceae]MBZ5877806.1 hypothetical protein [Chromohalobacter salexigens]MDF9436068.1 hypothetical protein [Chromohalobacter israelensis]SOC53975.1 hypothetical protein SAMN05421509_10343 [Chromohalobacter canadensis]